MHRWRGKLRNMACTGPPRTTHSLPLRTSTVSAQCAGTGVFRSNKSVSDCAVRPVHPAVHCSQRRQPNFIPLDNQRLLNVSLWFKRDEQLLLTSVEKYRAVNYDGEQPSMSCLSQFVIVRVQSCSGFEFSPMVVFDISADRCGLPVSFRCDLSSMDSTCRCSVQLGGLVVGEAIGSTALDAKMSAAASALCYLSTMCPTLIVKGQNTEIAIEDVITPAHLESQVKQTVDLGAQLTKSSEADDFSTWLCGVLSAYLETPHHKDLVFSPDFDQKHVDHIKAEAERRELLSLRWGECSSRKRKPFIVLCRYSNALQIVEHVRANGGETVRYILVEPTC